MKKNNEPSNAAFAVAAGKGAQGKAAETDGVAGATAEVIAAADE